MGIEAIGWPIFQNKISAVPPRMLNAGAPSTPATASMTKAAVVANPAVVVAATAEKAEANNNVNDLPAHVSDDCQTMRAAIAANPSGNASSIAQMGRW